MRPSHGLFLPVCGVAATIRAVAALACSAAGDSVLDAPPDLRIEFEAHGLGACAKELTPAALLKLLRCPAPSLPSEEDVMSRIELLGF